MPPAPSFSTASVAWAAPDSSQPRGAGHGDHRAGSAADREGERERQDAGRLHPRALAAAEQLGQLGRASSRRTGYAGVTPDWPDDPETVEEARANPDVFAKKTLKQVADHTAEVIDKLDRKPAVMGHSTGGLLAQMIADRGLSAATVAIDPGPFRGRPAAAALGAAVGRPGAAEPAQPGPRGHPHPRPVQVRLGQRARRRGGEAALRDLPRGRARGGPDADGERQPQPLHRGEGRPEESRARAAADHRRREGPHRPVGDRQRLLQAAEATTRPSPRSRRSRTAATR